MADSVRAPGRLHAGEGPYPLTLRSRLRGGGGTPWLISILMDFNENSIKLIENSIKFNENSMEINENQWWESAAWAEPLNPPPPQGGRACRT